jgi:hypothetical protein
LPLAPQPRLRVQSQCATLKLQLTQPTVQPEQAAVLRLLPPVALPTACEWLQA